MAGVSVRTIDYYTTLGLIRPAGRTSGNYRLYNDETLKRLHRIEYLKAQKLTLEEIRKQFSTLDRISADEFLTMKLTQLQTDLTRLEQEVKELEPVLDRLKPQQAKRLFQTLTPRTAACIEALLLLLGKNNFM